MDSLLEASSKPVLWQLFWWEYIHKYNYILLYSDDYWRQNKNNSIVFVFHKRLVVQFMVLFSRRVRNEETRFLSHWFLIPRVVKAKDSSQNLSSRQMRFNQNVLLSTEFSSRTWWITKDWLYTTNSADFKVNFLIRFI